MREIKVRAWDGNTGSWQKMDYHGFRFECGELKYPTGYKIMQFTGLHDKNGKEIWEGDLIRCAFDQKLISEVTFGRGAFCNDFGRSAIGNWNSADLGVLGNIYEHPHLLKESK